MCFKIDWASLIVGSKFTVSALFYFAFEGNFPSTSTRVAYIWRSDLTEGFCRVTRLGAYILGGAYFGNFTVYCKTMQHCHQLEGYLPKKSSALAISATLLVTPVILLYK